MPGHSSGKDLEGHVPMLHLLQIEGLISLQKERDRVKNNHPYFRQACTCFSFGSIAGRAGEAPSFALGAWIAVLLGGNGD